ncbi:hypothetical protein [Rubrobacter indicoceani]|uniref:hypothetical protein n=1 Tax=Rubrobacter indicoceani TaxID=2051957 RepID=UPI000E5A7177|nr:hypothetical protein [Rubrobacter indicoceani]
MSTIRNEPSKGVKDSPVGRRLTALALMFTLAGLSVACAEEEEASAREAPAGVVSSDVTDSPDNYLDSSVTVSGELGELVGERAFTIGGENFLDTEKLLVVSSGPLEEVVEGAEVGEFGPGDTGDLVQVEGTVRRFEDGAALEEELGTTADGQLYEEYAGEPVIVAERILLTPSATQEEQGRSDEPAAQAGSPTLFDLTRAPDDYYGNEVTVDGEVEDILDGEAFVVTGPGVVGANKGVLIVGEDGTVPEVSEGDAVRATGEFREFDRAEFERELNVTYEDELYVPYGLQPSIIATEIREL